jgi:hypothetical protein
LTVTSNSSEKHQGLTMTFTPLSPFYDLLNGDPERPTPKANS